MNLATLLADTARRLPDKPAVVVGPRVCTYAQLDSAAQRVADALTRAGVESGRKIAFTGTNGPEFIAALMGILRAGAVAVPAASDMKAPERADMIDQVKCEYALTLARPPDDAGGNGKIQHVRPFQDQTARDLYLAPTPHLSQGPPDERLLAVNASNIRFTSGTTASFKGVVLSHEGIAERIEVANRALRFSDRDTVYFGLQMAHHFAVSITLHLAVGATIVTGAAFLGDTILKQVQQHRATVIYTTPVTYRLMTQSPKADAQAMSSVRLAISTAMPLSREVEEAFQNKFGRPLTQALGIIEVGMPVMNLPGADYEPGALGRVIEGFEAHVLDEEGGQAEPGRIGELVLKGPGMLVAYCSPWRGRDDILDDGWFHTGDLVRPDETGRLFLVGRKKDVINVGGNKVFPLEVEDILNAHPAVAESVVMAAPDDVLGEVPSATVVPRAGTNVSTDEILTYCRQHLSPFKVPRHIRAVAQLPRTHSGKIARSQITAG